MNYDFGDILDARKAPEPLGHFVLILGQTRKNEEVMYYIITSRVYTVFKDIIFFFNDCILRKDKNFFKFFNKEKNKKSIISNGNLIDALFFDKHHCYDSCFDVDSMALINSDPKLIDKEALERLRSDGKVCFKNKLSATDLYKLISIIRYSLNISPDKRNQISASFNSVIKETQVRQLNSR